MARVVVFTTAVIVTAAAAVLALSFADVNTIHWRLGTPPLTLPFSPLTPPCLGAPLILGVCQSPSFPLLGAGCLAGLWRYFLALQRQGSRQRVMYVLLMLVICDACSIPLTCGRICMSTTAYVTGYMPYAL